MAETPMILTAMGGASQAYSAYQGGQANSAIESFNAKNERIQAEQALQSAGSEEARVDTKARILHGEQTSALAGQGVVTTAGTARAVTDSSEAASAMDKLMIGINARRRAFGFQVRAADADFRGHQDEVRGNEEAMGAVIRSGSTMAYENAKEGNSGAAPGRASVLAGDGSGAGDYNGGMNYGPNMAFT